MRQRTATCRPSVAAACACGCARNSADGARTGRSSAQAKTSDENGREIEGWLRIGRALSVDCELAWEIASADIWSRDRTADWSPTVTVRLHWQRAHLARRRDGGAGEPQPAGGSAQDDFSAGLLAQANFTFDAARAALEPGEAGRPHSFLPTLSAAAAEEVRFTLYGSPLPAEFKDNRVITWGRRAPTNDNPSPPWRRPPMRLTLASKQHVIKEIETVKINEIETVKPLTLRANAGDILPAGRRARPDARP